MKHILFLLVLTLAMTGCSSEEDYLQKNSEPPKSANKYKVSIEDAVNRARKAVSECGAVLTRSNAPARVDVIRSKALTRGDSDIPDTLLYVVNFENNGGFAVVGADTRALPLYAVSDSGELNITENSNEALKLVMEGIEEDAALRTMSISGPPVVPDSIHPPLIPGSNPRFPDWYYGYETSETVYPHLSKFQNRVNYYGDYSKYIFMPDGTPTYSGCGAVALEQLMSFYKWPESIDDYAIDWDRIDQEADVDAVAKILYLVGRPGYLSMKYRIEAESKAPLVGTIGYRAELTALKKLGYTYTEYFDFLPNEESVREELRDKPLMFHAYAITSDLTNGSGHMWIVDGWKCYKWVFPSFEDTDGDGVCDTDLSTYILDPNGYLYHCVWGDKNGNCNGYYYIKTVDGRRGFYENPDQYWRDDPRSTPGAEWHHHNSAIKYIKGVAPIK